MSQLVLSGHRVGYVTVTSSHVAANNFTGTNSIQGEVNGTASGRTRVKMLRIVALGPTINENWLRIYKVNTATSTYRLIHHEYIREVPVSMAAMTGIPPFVSVIRFPHDGIADEILYSPDFRLAYQLQATPTNNLQIEEVVADYVPAT